MMATITSRGLIETMLKNDGTYPGDPQAHSIYEYHNVDSNEIMWAVLYEPYERQPNLDDSPAVGDWALLWDRELGHVNKIGVVDGQKKAQA